jgi:hypothetical protein
MHVVIMQPGNQCASFGINNKFTIPGFKGSANLGDFSIPAADILQWDVKRTYTNRFTNDLCLNDLCLPD